MGLNILRIPENLVDYLGEDISFIYRENEREDTRESLWFQSRNKNNDTRTLGLKVATYKEGYPEEYIYVHSMADIMAYTTHSKNGDYKLYYESRVPTGKNRYMVSLEVFGKMFSLPLGRMNFEEYDVNEARHEICIPFFGYTGFAVRCGQIYRSKCKQRADKHRNSRRICKK